MNCRNLIISHFHVEINLFNQYLDSIVSMFATHNIDNVHNLQVVTQNQFVDAVLADPKNVGVCLGSSGVQESIFLNKKSGIRAALAHTKYIAEMCRKHNDANVMIIPTDCIGIKLASSLTEDYLLSAFDNEERNMIRIQKLIDLDSKY